MLGRLLTPVDSVSLCPWFRPGGPLVVASLLLFFLSLPPALAQNSLGEGDDTPEVPAATIAVASDAGSDADIERRLEQLYATIDGLDGVRVEARAGVVTLSGQVLSRAAREQAVKLARRVEKVVDVRDALTESRDVKERLAPTLDQLVAQFAAFLAMLPLLGVALVIVVLFWWLARLISGSRLFGRLFTSNPFLRDLAGQVVRVGIIAVGVVIALEILDASRLLTTLLGAAGVVGLALGFALRDTVENYIASLLLSLRQPFAHDDHVVIEGCEGRVVRLTPRATILMTMDGNHTRIPNAKVYKAVIVNYTRNPKRRFFFDVGVDTEQNLSDAQELAARTLMAMDGVIDDPAPFCTVQSLGDSNVILRVFGWVDQDKADFIKVCSEAIRLVKRAFDLAGIVMPEPIYNLRMRALPTELAGSGEPKEGAALSGSPARAPVSDEPETAVDIGPQDDLDQQIAADRSAGAADDLLSANAPRE